MTAAVVLPHGHLCVLVLVPSFSKVRVAKDIAIQMCDVLDGGEYVGVLNAPNMAAARKSKLTPYVSLGERMGALQAQLLGRGKVCLPVLLLLLLLLLSPIFRKECRLTIVLIQRTVRSTPLPTPRWVRRSAAKGL